MRLPTKGQVDAASRHVITAAGVAVTIFGLQAKGIDIAQVTAAIQATGSAVNDIVLAIAALATLYGGLKAAHSASPTQQIASVQAIAVDKTQPASQAAKVALLDATASLPEVVGNINVTDQQLVTDTSSQQIVKTRGMVS